MAFTAIPDVVRVIVRFTMGTFEFSNTFHCYKASFTLSEQTTLAAAIDLWFGTNWRPNWPTDITYLRTDAYDMRSSIAPVVSINTGTGPGAQAADTLPLNVAMCVTLRTAGRGKSSRGRVYLAGFSESDITDGVFSGAAMTKGSSVVGSVNTTITNSGFQYSVVSMQTNGVPNLPPLVQPVTAWEVRNGVPATQRRRLDRG